MCNQDLIQVGAPTATLLISLISSYCNVHVLPKNSSERPQLLLRWQRKNNKEVFTRCVQSYCATKVQLEISLCRWSNFVVTRKC